MPVRGGQQIDVRPQPASNASHVTPLSNARRLRRVRRSAGEPTSVPACGPAMAASPAFNLDVDGSGEDIIAVRDCEDGVRVARLDREGATLAQVDLPMAGKGAPSRLARDPAGRVGLATWKDADSGPMLHVLDPASLEEIRSPVPLERLEGCSSVGEVALVADPGTAGLWALLHRAAIGHGAGCASLARIEACR